MGSSLRIIHLFALFTCLSGAAQQLVWTDPIVVHRADQDPIRPRIVLNGDQRPVILWGEASFGANYVAIGEGSAFSTAQIIHPPDMHPAIADWQGSDLAAMGDQIYALMKMTPENSGGIFLVTSTDGGYTWSDTLRVDQVPGFKTRFSSIAVNGDGDPVIQYMRIDMGEMLHRTMVSKIVDGSVQPPIDVSSPFTVGEDCDCCPGQIVAEGDRVVAFFRDATENLRVIWASASNNAGTTFDQGAQVDPTDWILNACPSSGPDGVIDGEQIRYVWMSGAEAGSKIYFGSAGIDGLVAGDVLQIHPDQPQNVVQNHPRIAGAGDTLGVVWQQTATAQTEALFAWKLPGMNAFNTPDTLNVDLAGPQRSPDVTYSNGIFHFVWADYQENAIMYRTATVSPSIGIDEEKLDRIEVWPVPASERIQLQMDAIMSGGPVQIHDAIGKVVLVTTAATSIDVSSLSEGSYTIIISDRSDIPVARSQIVIAR